MITYHQGGLVAVGSASAERSFTLGERDKNDCRFELHPSSFGGGAELPVLVHWGCTTPTLSQSETPLCRCTADRNIIKGPLSPLQKSIT